MRTAIFSRAGLKSALELPLAMAQSAHAALRSTGRLNKAHAALRSSEAGYRLLADHCSDIIIRADISQTLLYVSPACRRLGYEADELFGTRGGDLIHPDDLAWLTPGGAALVDGAKPPARLLFRLRAKDGGWAWMEGTPSIVRDETGAPIEFITQLRDVSERVAFEADLIASRDAAECAARTKAEFLASMSHEIRTPLNSIMGFSSLLSDYEQDLPEQARRYLHHISTAGHGLLSVINDILDFSKLEAGQLNLDPQAFDPVGFIEDTVELMSAQAEQKGLTLGLIIDDSVPDRIDADPSRLRQVLLNLIGNAIKFTGEGRISVSVSHTGGAAGRLRVQVADTGPGISAERRDRLFHHHSQTDGSVSRRQGGAGLGLAICRSLANLMGGEIGVESEEDKGSVFWFTIAAPIVVTAQTSAVADAQTDARRACRILVVDDAAMNRELVRAMLEPLGHTFVEACDGPEALAAVRREAFDLILMDLQMPGMDGMAASRAIRAEAGANGSTPIIALSADVLPEQLAACAAAGMDDHIAKPIQPMRLLTKVTEWAHEKRALEVDDRLRA